MRGYVVLSMMMGAGSEIMVVTVSGPFKKVIGLVGLGVPLEHVVLAIESLRKRYA